jgi:hypothetical protein
MSENRIACKVGMLFAGIHLALASVIWFVLGGGEAWIYLAFFHLPSIALWQALFPHLLDSFGRFTEPFFFGAIGTISWFVFGWVMTRLVALYE